MHDVGITAVQERDMNVVTPLPGSMHTDDNDNNRQRDTKADAFRKCHC